jgi:hypothetical protein
LKNKKLEKMQGYQFYTQARPEEPSQSETSNSNQVRQVESFKCYYGTQDVYYKKKYKELEDYLNKCLQSGSDDSQFPRTEKQIDFDAYLICYIRVDLGLRETKIYTVHQTVPSLFSDYITLNYCDNFIVKWIISWYGCDTWSKFMNYCEKYGTLLEELVCLGATFDIEQGTMNSVCMDGTYRNNTKRIPLRWNRESYAFNTLQESTKPGSQIDNHRQPPTSTPSRNLKIKLRVNRS